MKRLSDVLQISPDGEVRPKHDVKAFIDEHDVLPMTWVEYEKHCRSRGRVPSLIEWSQSHGVFFDDEGPDVA